MNPSEECNEIKQYLLTLPELISAGITTQQSLSEEYQGLAPQGEPNSLDLDRLESTNFKFGEEFANNGGKNVKCNYDPKTKEIYWTIPDSDYTEEDLMDLKDKDPEKYEELMEGATTPDGEGIKMAGSGARMNNQQLIESQLDPNNPVPFFPTHGDPSSIINIMNEGDKEAEIPGLGEGLENNVLTLTNEVKDSQGNITEETEVIDKPEEVNKILRERVNRYDFSNTLNSSTAVNLYGNALKKNITKLDEIRKNKKSGDLNQTERRLMETWYGTNWVDNLDKGTVDVGDVFAEYEKNGTAGFGPYIGDEQGEAAKSDIVQWQRNILSNGLILDYEKQFIVPEPDYSSKKIEEFNVGSMNAGPSLNLPDENDPNISTTAVNLPNVSNGDTNGDGHLDEAEKEAMAAGEVKLKEADATGLNF